MLKRHTAKMLIFNLPTEAPNGDWDKLLGVLNLSRTYCSQSLRSWLYLNKTTQNKVPDWVVKYKVFSSTVNQLLSAIYKINSFIC